MTEQDFHLSDTAPPAPAVPVGLGTQAGLGATAAAVIGAIVAIFINGEMTVESITALAIGTVTLVTTMIGRFHQAAVIYRSQPTPLRGFGHAVRQILPSDEEIEEFERARDDEDGMRTESRLTP